MIFSRSRALLGEKALQRLAEVRVAVFGIGGVGSWCAEALARTGVGEMLLVDGDVVAPSNVNRQSMATSRTIGQPKTAVLKERLLEINPSLKVISHQRFYTEDTAGEFNLNGFDFAIDAIDSVADKVSLVHHALAVPGLTLFSSMGAAHRLDPLKIRISKFSKVAGDALARAMRQRFKKSGKFPSRDWTCVWSCEEPVKIPERGSILPVTGSFGFTLASLVIDKCIQSSKI